MGLHSFNRARALAAEQAALAAEEAAKPMPVKIEELPEQPTKRAYKRKKAEPVEVEPEQHPAEALEPVEAPVDDLSAE
jgi:hypothetical protein